MGCDTEGTGTEDMRPASRSPIVRVHTGEEVVVRRCTGALPDTAAEEQPVALLRDTHFR